MKPDFALSLSMEGISLLCRSEGGWHVIGDVPLEHAHLGSALAELRETGEALVDGPAFCKLVLPNDQIKYLQVAATDADAETQVASALAGATPYELSDLAYDFTETDDVFQVAAVARETLQEAEAFAIEHGFRPVCFVSVPDQDEFFGEPFFGATENAAQFLGAEVYPEPDEDEIYVTGRGAPVAFAPLGAIAAQPDEVEQLVAPSFASTRKPSEAGAPVLEAPIAAAEASVGVADTSPRFDPAAIVAGLKNTPAADTPSAIAAPAVANPAPPVREDPFASLASSSVMAPRKDGSVAGSRSKTIALYLIAILVVLLAGVVTWAAMFTDDGIAGLFQGEDVPQIVLTPEVDDPEIQALAPSDPDTITDSAEVEALEDAGLLDPIEDALEPTLEAEARYAATGIWDFAPKQPVAPTSERSEGIYLGSFEITQQTHDAIALPEAESFAIDLLPGPQYTPLPYGTEVEFDARGLVVATREGAITPEGHLVFLGKPEVVPAAFPQRTIIEPDVAETIPEAELALAAFRPTVRPSDLVEQNERANLGGSTRSELAALRPRLRPFDPAAIEAAASVVVSLAPAALQGATEQAVPASLRPAMRPSNFSQTVARVQEQMAAVAVPEAQTTQPSIPTSASVARSATQTNAINLRKVNLIGVYGTAAERRALVRLSSGRYKKVKVGDTLDGGRVAAIGESELRYVKGNRSIVLALPKG